MRRNVCSFDLGMVEGIRNSRSGGCGMDVSKAIWIKQTELVETAAVLALNLFQAMTTALGFESTQLDAPQMKGVLK